MSLKCESINLRRKWFTNIRLVCWDFCVWNAKCSRLIRE